MFQLILTRMGKNDKKYIDEMNFQRTVQMGWLVMFLAYKEVGKWILQVYNSHRQFIETSRPPSSLYILAIEHKNSPVCLRWTAAESHKIFCLLGPLRQKHCDTVWVVHLCLWTLLVWALETSFPFYQSVLLQWTGDSSTARSGWNLPLPL